MTRKVVVIIQARMGSTRLPGKVLIEVQGKPILEHLITRVKQCKTVDEIVVATTEAEQEKVIVECAERCGVSWFRGSEKDVLSRYYYAAKAFQADLVVRVTSDCPLIDPFVIDKMVQFYKANSYLLVTNAGGDLSKRTYPRGLDAEIFSFACLEKAFENAKAQYQREHVTPYIYENERSIYHYKNDQDFSNYRWTLDTTEDLELIKAIYEKLYNGRHDFYLNEILAVLDRYPGITAINQHIEQKSHKSSQ